MNAHGATVVSQLIPYILAHREGPMNALLNPPDPQCITYLPELGC